MDRIYDSPCGEEEAVLGALEGRERAFQVPVARGVPADDGARTRTHPHSSRGLRGGSANSGVRGEAEVVVEAEEGERDGRVRVRAWRGRGEGDAEVGRPRGEVLEGYARVRGPVGRLEATLGPLWGDGPSGGWVGACVLRAATAWDTGWTDGEGGRDTTQSNALNM